ncbi:hypothetical protein CEXT_200951 [Caerostris extrusa]|uniref:Uncharacterized protein n=1 Tax=Caerostris extrusa TaxID=172846 RepID=A0AAV4ML30_CAEEX|nr:hypothetical protein CEXT_200951 [Caerostris extrusa]
MLGDMSGKMESIIGRINADREKVFGFKEIKNIEKVIKEELKGKEIILKSLKKDQAALNALKAVEGLSQIAQFTSSAIGDIRSQIKEDEAKVDELNKAIKEADNRYQSLQLYDEKFTTL